MPQKLGDDMKSRTFGIVIICLSVLFSCNRPDKAAAHKSHADLGTQVQGDWVIVRWEGEPDTLNPILNHNAYAAYAMYGDNSNQIYDFLLAYNTTDWTFSKPVLVEAPPIISD